MTTAGSHSIREFQEAYSRDGHLRGFRSACGFVTATWGLACPQCGARDLEEYPLPATGRIAAFTVQTVPAEEFLGEAPYAYLLVDLDGGGRISGWMSGGTDPWGVAIGAVVHLVGSARPGVKFALGPAEAPRA